ncbi:MAG: RidA family protein [Spirochaetia bacterium]|jgi:2-iminobutanoate/2-iminopropanoate deaminase|nr:RidA family protein [Spirochaetia bacterium]
MKRSVISTSNAPAAVGPYSQAVTAGEFVYCSGQVPLIPETGKMVEGGIEEQTRQALNNLSAVLAAAGSSLADTLKIQIFITDMGNFSRMNAVYSEFFEGDYPARFCVEVSALPLGALVEIDAVGLCRA